MELKKLVPGFLHPRNTIGKYLVRISEGKILGGPFKGMKYRYPPELFEENTSALFPKIMGVYEKEIHPFIYSSLQAGYNSIINVGAGEGYYSTGFAIKSPQSQVFAFDLVPQLQKIQLDNAKLNEVTDRIFIFGRCEPTDLDRIVRESANTLLFIDCEGFEMELLNISRAPELRMADIIVETHDFEGKDTFLPLLERFGSTHTYEIAHITPRSVGDIAIHLPWHLKLLPAGYKAHIVREGRVKKDQKWIYFKSKMKAL